MRPALICSTLLVCAAAAWASPDEPSRDEAPPSIAVQSAVGAAFAGGVFGLNYSVGASYRWSRWSLGLEWIHSPVGDAPFFGSRLTLAPIFGARFQVLAGELELGLGPGVTSRGLLWVRSVPTGPSVTGIVSYYRPISAGWLDAGTKFQVTVAEDHVGSHAAIGLSLRARFASAP
jgi:hypothetical protein